MGLGWKRCVRLSGVALLVAMFFLAVAPARASEGPSPRPDVTPIPRQPLELRQERLAQDNPHRNSRVLSPGLTAEALSSPMYLRTAGPQGQPATKNCGGCSQFLEAAGAPGGKPLSGWQILETEGFEDDWPGTGSCQIVYDASADGLDRTWGRDDQHAHSAASALWPAAGGEDGIAPAGDYPADLNSWLICGPFDLSAASSASVAFWLWSDVETDHDEVFFGVGDGADDWFYGYAWDESVAPWTQYTIYFPAFTGSVAHDSVWLAWNFESDAGNLGDYAGSWLDDIQIAMSLPCPVVDPGPKGLNVHPSELPHQVETIADGGANWVRLELMMEPGGAPDLDRYAGLVDSLCAEGMAPIGLVDYTTLPEDLDEDGQADYDDAADYIAYQRRFTQTVESLGHHFRGQIRHWEIWNEENGLQWHIRPEYYARLLVHASETLKAIDADNQILLGGLDHVWVTGQYLEPLYDALDDDWAGARPFDILAVHPYFTWKDGAYVLDPNDYLWGDGDPPPTTLDAYLDYMAARGDGDKEIWVTELGWNSALDNPAVENCPGIKPWCVDRATQAQYLGDSFDLLLNAVEDPLGNHDRVGTIVWYQYHDTAWSVAEMARWLSVDAATIAADPDAICPADWGLVDGNRAPKPAYWAYQAYPQRAAGWQLVSFTATPQPTGVRLAWETAAEEDLLGFALYRAESPGGPRVPLNGGLIPAQSPGQPQGAAYETWDGGVTGGTTYFYYLQGLCGVEPTVLYGPVRATTGVYPLAATNNGPTPLGRPATLTATLNISPAVAFTYTWALGDSSQAWGPVVTHTYPHPGVYTAVVTASKGLSELLATTMVSVDEIITGLLAIGDSPTALGEPTTLTATTAAGSHVNYLWALGDGGWGVGPVITHTYPAAQVYTAVVTASNSVSALTATTNVKIDPRSNLYQYLPLVVRQSP
ncbi:MAG: PKD domain-containing protein [Anaerolineae bacterium]